MTHWIPSATWEPVPGGLCSSSGFQADMVRSTNEKSPWFKLPIFGELRLNNLGRLEARRERKVSSPSFSALHIFPDFHSAFLVSNMFLCRGWRKPTGPNKKLGERPSAPETQPRTRHRRAISRPRRRRARIRLHIPQRASRSCSWRRRHHQLCRGSRRTQRRRALFAAEYDRRRRPCRR